MMRLSYVLKELKAARNSLNSVLARSSYFIVEGESSNLIKTKVTGNINDCLYLEQYLRLSVSKSCQCLDGFDKDRMDPIDYISSSDVKNTFIDVCLSKKVVATINLTTGEITNLQPENCNMVEEKDSAEKSQQSQPLYKYYNCLSFERSKTVA